MQADFHLHSVFSPDSLLELKDIARIVRERKIGCIALTDHDTINGALALLEMSLPCQVIIGEEISTADGEIIGLFLKETIPAKLGILATIRLIREQQGIVVLPHPCDRLRRHVLNSDLWQEVLPEVDLVEGFNGRTVFTRDDNLAVELANQYHKPLIAGSDSHTSWELGRCGMIIAEFQSTAEFLERIGQGKFFGRRTAPWVHAVTKGVKYANRTGLRTRGKDVENGKSCSGDRKN